MMAGVHADRGSCRPVFMLAGDHDGRGSCRQGFMQAAGVHAAGMQAGVHAWLAQIMRVA